MSRPPRRARRGAIALGALVLALLGRVALTYAVLSVTVDEPRYLAAGLEAVETRAFTLYYWSPALPHYCHGLLPSLAGARLPAGTDEGSAARILDSVPSSALLLARLGTLPFLLMLPVYAWLWSSRLFGRTAGLAAAVLVSTLPDVIAHGSLATSDLPSAATALAAFFHLWRWCDRPSMAHAALAGAAFAAAALCKGPVIAQLALVSLAFVVLAGLGRRSADSRRAVITAGQWAVSVGVAGAAVWLAYGLACGPLGARPGARDALDEALGLPLAARVAGWTVPMPAYFDGLFVVLRLARFGWRGYLLGSVSETGWWYYFPVVLALKTPFPFLGLLALAAARLRVVRHALFRRRALYPLAAASVFLGVAMTSRTNIGVRHVLAVEVVLAVVASAAFLGPWRAGSLRASWLRGAAVVLIAWQAVESVAAHPDYLAYTNPVARGREWQYLGDSNVDWAQDVGRLGDYLKANGIVAVRTSPGFDPAGVLRRRGIAATPIRSATERPAGVIAASTLSLEGMEPDLSWLQAHSPVARIGRTIFVYRLPPGRAAAERRALRDRMQER